MSGAARDSGDRPSGGGGRLDRIVDRWTLGVGVLRNVSVRVGFNMGMGAYLLGYVATYVLLAIEAGRSLNDYLTPNSKFVYEPVGWIFYGAHTVPVSSSNLDGSENVNYLLNAHDALGMAIPTVIYYAVPVAVLGLAGYLAARRVDARRQVTGILAGASVVFGYFVLAYFGAYFFEVMIGRNQYVKPDVTTSLLVIGLAYPIVFGAIGGSIAVSRAPEPLS